MTFQGFQSNVSAEFYDGLYPSFKDYPALNPKQITIRPSPNNEPIKRKISWSGIVGNKLHSPTS